MKIISIILACAMLAGCATLKENATPANARIATTLVCQNAINYAVNTDDQVETANYIFAVAHAVRTLSGGKVPTPAELKAAIDVFTPNGQKWVNLAMNISSIYGAFYPQIVGNSALALEYLEAVAAGCEDAASSFIRP